MGSMAEQNIPCLEVPFPLAFDAGGQISRGFKQKSGLMSLGPGAAYLVDQTGIIRWREQFSSGHPLSAGQFEEQCRRFLNGEDLVDNGEAPVEEEVGQMDIGDELDAFGDDADY